MSTAAVVFADYLPKIADHPHQEEFFAVLDWVLTQHPELTPVVKWNQPMFTHHGTFIIGFSASKAHFSVAPEVLDEVLEVVEDAGYTHGTKLFRVPFGKPVNYAVIEHVIQHNMRVKQNVTSFWR